jgi:mercuric ion binding protein
MKKIIYGMLLLFVAISTQAQDKISKNAKYIFEVNGNCEQCQKRIQKAAFSVDGVKMASWSLETHEMTIIINEEKCSLLEVTKAIANVGHDTKEVKAKDEVYEKLHACCQYERD